MMSSGKTSPPTDDKRWQNVEKSMRRYGYEPSALIQTLHAVQETFGYLDLDAMRFVSGALRVPLSQVYGVATFYHFFTLKPQGEHTCMICTGTACYIRGAEPLLEAVKETVGTKPGETSKDGKVSLLTVRCIGSCGLAPIAVLDGETAGRITPEVLQQRLRAWSEAGAAGGVPPGIPTAPPEGPGPQLGNVRGAAPGGPAAEEGGGE
jgi:bidirectional [NiFe] hydrogenase diaphorase subunit